MTNPTLFLIDTFSLLFQVFHAIPSMTSPKGLPANAVFGFTRDLFNLLQTQRPTHWLCAMDSPGSGTRETLYSHYKANRTEMPADLRPQIEMVQQIMEGFGIPHLRCDGWEADDVIATLTRQAVERGWDVRIVTNDKDARQLLGPNVRIFNVRKNTWFDEADLKADWGVRPDQAIDFQALVGDSVDNVPGVPLVGPKKATALLEQFGSLDEVLANADKVTGEKLKSNLKEFADLARLSRTLVTLNQHLELNADWETMRVGQVDVARLTALFNEFGFRRFIDEAKALPTELKRTSSEFPLESVTSPPPEPARRWENVETPAQLATFLEHLRSQREFCLEVIASATNSPSAEIVALAFAWEDCQSWFVAVHSSPVLVPSEDLESRDAPPECSLPPVSRPRRQQSLFDDDIPESSDTDSSEVVLVRAPALPSVRSTALRLPHGWQSRSTEISGNVYDTEQNLLAVRRLQETAEQSDAPQNLTHLQQVSETVESDLAPHVSVMQALRPILESSDVQVVGHDLKSDGRLLRREGIHLTGFGVDPMVASYLVEATARGHDLAALAERHLHRTLPPFETALLEDPKRLAEWATERADITWQLSRQLGDELRRAGLWDLYWNLERPLIGVLADIEATGIRVDVSELQRQSAEIGRRLTELIAEIHQLAGHEFNIDSPKQLAKVLFEELNLPVLKKTKTGSSTDQDVLEKLALVHPLPARIIEHRQLSKLRGTYLDSLPEMVNPRTGKIHAHFNQVVAATGRLSCSDPNLQNIPIRTTEGQRVRRAFIPSEPGWKFVCADYSQIELRMLAHFCVDPVLREAFAAGTDIHTAVACEIFNVTPDIVSFEQRRIAKAVNFGVLYGQSAFGLAEALHIEQDKATLFIDQYFAKYATIDDYITRTLAEVARTGYATTILGRRRAIDGIRPDRKRQLNLSERTAINTVIQGSAADLIKQAMLRVHHRLAETQHPGRLLLQIHDELVFETPADSVDSLAMLVRHEMTTAMTLNVPLTVDVSVGDNWQDLSAL
ncbi:MAG: DNA polymerase I [Planctomycetaceae bacterium]